MQTKTDVLFDVDGQSLILDAREGRPSSVESVQVFEDINPDSSPESDALDGSPAIEALTTTIDAAAGPTQTYRTTVPVASTAGITVGRRLLLENSLGQREWIDVAGVESGVSLRATVPLTFTYADGDTVESPRISVNLSNTWVANASNVSNPICPRPRYRVVWTYVVDGETYRVTTFFDLTRQPFTHSVTALDLDRLSRGLLSRLSTEDRTTAGAELIEEAALQVRHDLWEHGLAAYAQRNSEAVNEFIRRKANVLVHEHAFNEGGVSQVQLDAVSRAYWQRLENLITKTNQQVTAEGAGGQTQEAPLYRR